MLVPKRTIVATLFVLLGFLLVGILLIGGANPLLAQDGPSSTEEPHGTPEVGDDGIDGEEDELVARGRYLVHAVAACQDCHIGGGDYNAVFNNTLRASLAGGYVFINQPWGQVTAPNLTILHEWSDEQIENAIRYGARPDGSPLLPPMPYEAYANLADDDMTAIIAYLRSLEPEVSEMTEPVLLEGLTREDIRAVPEIDPESEYPAVDSDDRLAYGEYLGRHVAACVRCHGSVSETGTLDPDGPLAGQVYIYGEFDAFQAPSLASDDLSEGVVFTVLHEGIKANGRGVFIMPAYAYMQMTEADAQAIAAWVISARP